jgi:hypothetical protein
MNDLSALEVAVKDGDVRFSVHAKPRAKKSAIVGVREGALHVAIGAPPVDGAANAELVAFLARALGIRQSDIEIVRGEGARAKLVSVRGIDETQLRAKLVARIVHR